MLHREQYPITFLAAFIEVVLLIIESYLRKSVSVKEIVDSICNVESIDTCSVNIVCWILCSGVHCIVKIKGIRTLRRRGTCITLVNNNIVTPSTRQVILSFNMYTKILRVTHSVLVVLVVDTECQPGQSIIEGEATMSSGSVKS